MTQQDAVWWLHALLMGFSVFVTALVTGYGVWSRLRGSTSGQAPRWALLPFAAALYVGLLSIVLIWSNLPAAGADKFYSPRQQLYIGWTLIGALTALLVVAVKMNASAPETSPENGRPGLVPRALGRPQKRLAYAYGLDLCILLTAATLVAWFGVRFEVLGFGPLRLHPLGNWAIPLTVAWILVATYATKLLDGLDGALPILTLTATVAVLVTTRGTSEFFLALLCVAILAATLGTLRFHFFPSRLPLRGTATLAFGFFFALLTVMARQKTVAALLLIFPLAVVVLLLGSSMLGLLERTLLLPPEGPADEPDAPISESRKNDET